MYYYFYPNYYCCAPYGYGTALQPNLGVGGHNPGPGGHNPGPPPQSFEGWAMMTAPPRPPSFGTASTVTQNGGDGSVPPPPDEPVPVGGAFHPGYGGFHMTAPPRPPYGSPPPTSGAPSFGGVYGPYGPRATQYQSFGRF